MSRPDSNLTTQSTTLEDIQRHMSTPRRLCSKILHASPIDYLLEILSRTLFLPYAVIGAALGASITLSLSYFIAFYAGYTLTGAESYIGLLPGWIIGLFVDFIKNHRHTS